MAISRSPNWEADFGRVTSNREINKKATPTSGSPTIDQERYFF
jgi:hypothetical protein